MAEPAYFHPEQVATYPLQVATCPFAELLPGDLPARVDSREDAWLELNIFACSADPGHPHRRNTQ
ncbi:hypothetical protein [Streptomyces sp. NPDC051569]|uniref:hypothetical protein n=1 Tax=Streptomyces sp. NPDC051569 TaxID=3365661 RepID=UPI0037A6C50C